MRYKKLILVMILGILFFTFCAKSAHCSSIKAFSIREANLRLKQGIAMDDELHTLGGITRFVGMVIDRETSDIILVGKVIDSLPRASLDDLIVALRCRLIYDQWPLVSIDATEDTAKTRMQKVRFQGGIEGTLFGNDLLESDIILKKYSLNLLENVKGADSYLKLYEEDLKQRMEKEGRHVESFEWFSPDEKEDVFKCFHGKNATEQQTVQSRFWFYPLDDFFATESDDVYVIDKLCLGVMSQIISHSKQGAKEQIIPKTKDEIGEKFAADFSKQWVKICEKYPKINRLKVLFDLVTISEGISHLGEDRPEIDYLLNEYQVEPFKTPKTYPLIKMRGLLNSSEKTFSTIVQISGGIKVKTIILALNDGDVSALKMAVLKTRPHDHALSWIIPLDSWEMPNDILKAERGGQQDIESVIDEEEEIGFSLTTQIYKFDSNKQGQIEFLGFPKISPFPMLNIPAPRIHYQESLGGVEIVPQPAGKKGDLHGLKKQVIESKPKEESLIWTIKSPAKE